MALKGQELNGMSEFKGVSNQIWILLSVCSIEMNLVIADM